MKNPQTRVTEAAILRQKAEEQLKKKSSKTDSKLSETETLKLVHELQVHQIELEIQNEALVLAKVEADVATQKYIELYDFAPSGYFTLSNEGKIIELNLHVASMLGKERHRLINNTFGIFVSHETKLIFNRFLSNVFESKKEESCEVTISNTDGKQPLNVFLTGRISEDFTLCHVTMIDITERKKSEEALSKQNSMFSTLLQNLQIGVYMIEVPSGKPLLANEASYRLLGRGILPEANSSTITKVYDLYKTGTNIPYPNEELPLVVAMNGVSKHVDDMDVMKPDGRRTALEVFGSPIKDKKGNIWASLVSFQDITERKKAEKAIREIGDKLFHLNADKDRFISILSHDLRSPFNALLGLSEVLKEDVRKLDINGIENIANDINTTAQRTYNLLEDILTWARAQQGKISFEPQILSFAEICIDIHKTLNLAANAKNITLDYLKADHIYVFADINMLKTILRNLVSNAIKFTNNGGTINISAIQSDSDITISVSDNGIGIPPDSLAKLFDISEVLSTKGTADETGTGLGLLLCKEFVEKHGGRIWVESEVGKGSEFKFTLPFNAETDEVNTTKNKVSSPKINSNITNLKILITDDDDASRKFLGITIKAFAKEIIYAQNGFEAVVACKENPDIDLILMDINMPNMDGFEATRQIRQFNKEVIIIVQSAYTDSGEKEKAKEAGCNEFISKPINKTLLKELIKKYFDN